MPFTHPAEEEARHEGRSPVSPVRRSRNPHTETTESLSASLSNGSTQDGRPGALNAGAHPQTPPAHAPVPGPPVHPSPAVLVAHDGGPAGRAALDHAVRHVPGTVVVVHLWEAVDPLVAARVGGVPGAGGELLHAVHDDNERARAAAERLAAEAVALAQEGGRTATAVVRRDEGVAGLDAHLRELAERHEAAHLVVPVRRQSRLRRFLLGPSPGERLAADPPCPCTIVPT